MAKIAYATKVSNNGESINGKFFSADANEIKAAVNALYDLVDQNSTPIPITVDGDFVVANWQTNLVPSDPLARTFVQRFGNVIKQVSGMQILPNGKFELYNPSAVTVTYSGANITTVTFNNLFIGNLSII